VSGIRCQDQLCEMSCDLLLGQRRSHDTSRDLSESKQRLHKLRRNLESSKAQYMTLKTYREEKRIATKSTIMKGILSEEATHVQ